MQLRVIGAAPAWGNPGEACSCHLVDTGAGRLLLDLGNGALSRLLTVRGAPPAAVVVSHLHPDHFADLVPLAYGLAYGGFGWPRPSLHVPAGGLEILDGLARLWGQDLEGLFGIVLDLREYGAREPFAIAGAVVHAAPAAHSGLAHCLRVEAGGRVLGYTGDSAPSADVAAHLEGSHLLLAEAVVPEGADGSAHGHSTATEAAGLAVDAKVERLVLTHVPSALRAQGLRAARARFPRTDLALPGLRTAV